LARGAGFFNPLTVRLFYNFLKPSRSTCGFLPFFQRHGICVVSLSRPSRRTMP
jgi:hypothetical protein